MSGARRTEGFERATQATERRATATEDEITAMAGLLDPVIEETAVGRVEVRETFQVPKIGTVAGSYVVEGRVRKDNARVRISARLVDAG